MSYLRLAPSLFSALGLLCLGVACDRDQATPSTDDTQWDALFSLEETPERFPIYEVHRITPDQLADITIDGRLDEPLWATLPAFSLHPLGGGTYRTTVRAAYTDTHLLVGAWMEDTNVWAHLTERDASLWNEEVFELFLAPQGPDHPYVELQVNPQNAIFDARFEMPPRLSPDSRAAIDEARAWDLQDLQTAVFLDGELNDPNHTDRAWSLEMVIPLEHLDVPGSPPAPGDTWRVNAYRFDRPDDATDHAYAFSTRLRGDFHQLQHFGLFRFADTAPHTPDVQ